MHFRGSFVGSLKMGESWTQGSLSSASPELYEPASR